LLGTESVANSDLEVWSLANRAVTSSIKNPVSLDLCWVKDNAEKSFLGCYPRIRNRTVVGSNPTIGFRFQRFLPKLGDQRAIETQFNGSKMLSAKSPRAFLFVVNPWWWIG
jgi:hypothetical protein